MNPAIDLFKALTDPTRLRVMRLLNDCQSELCVCELVDSLEEPQCNVSRHLRVLKQAGLVTEHREGKWVYYEAQFPPGQFGRTLRRTIESVPDTEGAFAADRERLDERLALREQGKCLVGIQKCHLAPGGSGQRK